MSDIKTRDISYYIMEVAVGLRLEDQFWGVFSVLEICHSVRDRLWLSLLGLESGEIFKFEKIGILEGVAFGFHSDGQFRWRKCQLRNLNLRKGGKICRLGEGQHLDYKSS